MTKEKGMKKIIFIATIGIILGSVLSGNLSAQTASELYEAGTASYNSGDYETAIAKYSEVLKQIGLGVSTTTTPGNFGFDTVTTSITSDGINSLWMRALSYSNIKKYDAAISDFEQVIKFLPNVPEQYRSQYSPGVYCSIGDTYAAMKDYTKAVSNWEKYLDMASPAQKINYGVNKAYAGDMWFCATLWRKALQNKGAAVGAKFEKWINEICSTNPVNRNEIERFYKRNMEQE
jgi:tetratricopeptide (TPR) repeat protein